MNRLRCYWRQGLALLCGFLLVVALLAYPPWRVTRHHQQNVSSGGLWHFAGYAYSTTEFVGYAPLLRPPRGGWWEADEPNQPDPLFGPHRYQSLGFESVYAIDWSRLLIPIVVVCFVSMVAAYELRGRPVILACPKTAGTSPAARQA